MITRKAIKHQPLFRSCSNCQIRLLSSALEEHLASNCEPPVFPSIISLQDEGKHKLLLLKLTSLSPNSKILDLPVMLMKQSSSLVFIPEELMLEAGFTTLGWVLISIHEDSNLEFRVSFPMNQIAFRVWPISCSDPVPRGDHMKGFLNEIGFLIHPSLKEMEVGQFIRITIPNEQISSPFTIFPVCVHILIEVDESKNKAKQKMKIDEGNMGQNLCKQVESILEDRLVAEGNLFQLKFYAELVKFTIVEVHGEAFGDLFRFPYHLVNSETKVSIVKRNYDSVNDNGQGNEISLDDVGGAQEVIREISLAIKNVLEYPVPDALRGILLYGNYGTGKSLLVQAVCNFLKLHVVLYMEYPPYSLVTSKARFSMCKSLHEAFNEAILRAPCAIVIENLETLNSENGEDSSWNLSAILRSEFDRLGALHAKVVVLATTSDLDSVDLSCRSSSLFGRELEMPIPSVKEREDILIKLVRKMNHVLTAEHVKLIAGSTHGYVGADLHALCNEAAMKAIRSPQNKSFNMKDIEECMKTVRPSAMKGFLIEVPNVKWSDIGGQEDLKFKLKQAIEWPLKHPEAFSRMGITPPKGFLMYGPPGCSKTMIAKAVATESGLNFISIKGSEIFSKWVGESEKAIQSLFRKAREVAPSIVFIDEIDSIGGERGNSSSSSSSSVNERVLSQLLVEIDGIESLKDVTIVAATNRPDIIDQALIRPGRLDRIIYVPLPDVGTRKDIFRIRFNKMPVHTSVDVDRLVLLTEGYSGAEITAICQEAALKALEEDIESKVIQENHFMEALNIVKPRISVEQIEFYENYSKSRFK